MYFKTLGLFVEVNFQPLNHSKDDKNLLFLLSFSNYFASFAKSFLLFFSLNMNFLMWFGSTL